MSTFRIQSWNWRSTLISVLAALAALGLVSAFAPNPSESFLLLLGGPFRSRLILGNTLAYATLLCFSGLGITLAFRAGSFNLGGEAQVAVPALLVVIAGSAADWVPGIIGVPLLLALGAAAGAVLAAISGLLRAHLDIDELLSSFLISAGLIPVVDYLVTGPLRDSGSSLLATVPVSDAYRLPALLPPSRLSVALPIAVLVVLLLSAWERRSRAGFELRLLGANERFARYAGVPLPAARAGAMAVSGALHGMAGAAAVLGSFGAMFAGMTSGVGWNGIAVALLAGLQPILVLPAALVMAWIVTGAASAQVLSGLSTSLTTLLQGIVLLILALGRRR